MIRYFAVAGGFIPACAGRRWLRTAVAMMHGVYPRVCGEEGAVEAGPCGVAGLSPRVRGGAATGFLQALGLRFIPACAGRRALAGIFRRVHRVYPRVCGEEASQCNRRGGFQGLSPRVRGGGHA